MASLWISGNLNNALDTALMELMKCVDAPRDSSLHIADASSPNSSTPDTTQSSLIAVIGWCTSNPYAMSLPSLTSQEMNRFLGANIYIHGNSVFAVR